MREFTTTHKDWLTDYCAAVARHFSGVFVSSSTAFPEADVLLNRFGDARDAVISDGWKRWPTLDEAHNELCIAAAILEAPNYQIDELSYEPLPAVGAKTVDFLAKGNDGRLWLVDVKTIAPKLIDRWNQFETAHANEWLPDSANLVLAREWLGGELWHGKVASRSRMLEYTLELEGKLTGYPEFGPDTAILMFCTNGFHWHEDELEDFVALYADGQHRADDVLATMERHFIETQGLDLPRRVKRFGYCQRESQSITPSRVNWWVRPPRLPAALARESAV